MNNPRKRVLVADDSPEMRSSLHKLFEKGGWDCAEVVDGPAAISKALESKPHLVVLDLSMPGMNGITAGRLIRETVPDSRLILFSSFAHLLPLEQMRRSGFSAIVSKDHPASLLSEAQVCTESH